MRPVTPERQAEVAAVVDSLRSWAEGDARVAALALVGSWAAGTASEGSDVDLVVLSARPGSLLDDHRWFEAVEPARLVRAGRFGAVAERRLRRPSGLDVEICVGDRAWARTHPVDPGTRQVVVDGLRVLVDPEHLLADLLTALGRPRVAT